MACQLLVTYRQLRRSHIAVAYSHDICLTLQFYLQQLMGTQHPATLAVGCHDSDKLQVLAIGLPATRLRFQPERHSLSGSGKLMTRHYLSCLPCHSHQCARLIRHSIPAYAVAQFGISVILFYSQAPAIEQQFHLIDIRIGIE